MAQKKEHSAFDLGIIEHTLSVQEVCQKFDSDSLNGLSTELVDVNRQKYGTNKFCPPKPRSIFYRVMKHVLQGVSSLMVSGAIVCLMSFVADLIGDLDSKVDLENLLLGVALFLFIILTGVASYIRERMALNVLRKSVSLVIHKALVVRNGMKMSLDVKDIVAGDLVELKYGDEVPADIRVIESVGFKVDSAPLTGLSEPVTIKTECTHPNPLITQNMLYSSTYGVEGFCRGIVIRVGDNTVVGRITGITSLLKEKQTPLSKDVTKLVLTFTSIGIVFAIICWVAAMSHDFSWSNTTVFFVGVCVAIVPESLLAAIKVCHSVAAKRMIKKGCIAKRFDAIENLGSTSVLCIDKTGTLTQNKLTVCSLWAGESIVVNNDRIQGYNEEITHRHKLYNLVHCIVLTSRATAQRIGEGDTGSYEVKDGEPADNALLKFALTASNLRMELKSESTKLHEIPFNYRTFYQLFIYLEPPRSKIPTCRIVVRGAPERVFRLCSTIFIQGKEEPITIETRKLVEAALLAMAQRQERVFGFCDKVIPYSPNLIFSGSNKNYPTNEYRFLGLVSLSDPPRVGTKELIARLRSACIKVVLLTGDHPTTAMAIANAVGIVTKENIDNTSINPAGILGDSDFKELVRTGKLADVLKGEELVFARLSPEQKAIIVETFQQQGELVTMVGDGINDCAAMRAADTSISFGSGSSEAAKEISDIVINDDSLSSVATGIEEGRLVFENLKKCFAFTISSNIPEVLPFVLFLFLGIPLPINPISIILLTVGIDMLPAISLAYEPAEYDLMKYPMQDTSKHHKLFSARLMERAYARIGIIEFCAGMLSYAYVMSQNGFHLSDLVFSSYHWYSTRVVTDSHGEEWSFTQRRHLEDVCQTVYFYAVALVQLVHLIGCKTRRQSIFVHGFKNWRLIFALIIPLVIIIVILRTQVLHIIEIPRIEAIPPRLLLPAIPFAIFIFIYAEFRRFIIRKFPEGYFGERFDL